MITKAQTIFLALCFGLLVFSAETVALLIQSSVCVTFHEKEKYLLGLGLAWALFLAVWLFIRTRRPRLWTSFIDAERSLRARFGLRPANERAIRLLEHRFLVTLGIVLLAVLLWTMALTGLALFIFPSDL
jgi:hypothetical protein